MFDAISGELPGTEPPRVAVIATGGYGRNELAPRSDVDLLALLPSDDASAGGPGQGGRRRRAAASRLVGRGSRSGVRRADPGQTLSLAREDHTARTALLDCRLVCGDAAPFKELERAMVTELEARKVEEFIQEKLEELQVRRKRYGGSVWLLEPHLKQGKGGLRDLQAGSGLPASATRWPAWARQESAASCPRARSRRPARRATCSGACATSSITRRDGGTTASPSTTSGAPPPR